MSCGGLGQSYFSVMYEGRVCGNTRECIVNDDAAARHQFGVGWILMQRDAVESFAAENDIDVGETIDALWEVYKRVYMAYHYSVNSRSRTTELDDAQWVRRLRALAVERLRRRKADAEQLRRVYSTVRNVSRPADYAIVVREPMRPRVVAGPMAPSYMCEPTN